MARDVSPRGVCKQRSTLSPKARLIAALTAAALIALAAGRVADATERSSEQWEFCWETAQGTCKYRCYEEPDVCPCWTTDGCPFPDET